MARSILMMLSLTLVLLVNTGCFEITEFIKLNRDLSGTSTIEISIDMEKMLGPLAAMAGEDFDLESEMEGIMAKQGADLDPKLEELKASLPDGVQFLSKEQRIDGAKMIIAVALAFDDLGALSEFRRQDTVNRLGGDSAGGAASPVGGVTVTQRAGELILQFDPLSLDDGDDTPDDDEVTDPAVEAMVERMLSDSFRVSLVIDAPFTVTDHNASSVSGSEVRWDFDMMELSRLSQAGNAPAPRVAFQTDRAIAASAATVQDKQEPARAASGAQITALSGKAVITLREVAGGSVELEGRRRRVAPFFMSTTEITQRQWKKVMGSKPSACESGCGKQYPVQNVSWLDAAHFANELSTREGLRPCYLIDGEVVEAPDGPQCPGYRLASEAEWELAVRAGSSDRYPWGNHENGAGVYAWHSGNSDQEAHPVATKEANPTGLFDLSGNVAEWVYDPFGSNDADRVARGGSFADAPETLESSARRAYPPRIGHRHVGVRVVRSVR